MHSVKLTLVIEDPADVDMELRVIVQEPTQEASIVRFTPHAVTACRDTGDDEYALGGYAGI